jgi:hypothetical protein
LNIEGIPQPVTVDPSFANLSPADQERTVEEIRSAWQAQGKRLVTDTAAFAGTPQRPTDRSFFGAIRHGLEGESEGFASTARVLGATDTAQGLSDSIAPPSSYEAATPELMEALRKIDLRRAAGLLPRAIAEQAPGLGGTLAAGSAGAALGSVVPGLGTAAGGLIGAGLYAAGRGFGENVEERAKNNGHAEPTASDYVGGAATTAASAALDAVGARGLGGAAARLRLAQAASNAPRETAQAIFQRRLQEAAVATGREAATEGAQEAIQETGTTLGTDQGLELDPAQIAGAAVLGGATRATLGAPGLAREAAGAGVRAATNAAADASIRREMGDLTPERAASIERVNQAIGQRADETGRETDTAVHLRSVGAELDGQLSRTLRQARSQGWLDDDQHADLSDLLTNARRHNQELSEGRVSEDGTTTGLAQLDAMENLPPAFRGAFRALLMDRNTISSSLRPGTASGPFERLGAGAGRVAAAVTGGLSHGPLGAVAGAVAGGPLAARIGGGLGRMLDQRAGASQPVVVRARRMALAELERSGVDPSTLAEEVKHLDAVLDDQRMASRAALGLATDEAAMAKEATQMARNRASWVQRRIAQGLEVTEAELAGLTDLDRQNVLERMRFDVDRIAAQAPRATSADAAQLQRGAATATSLKQRQEDAAWSGAAGLRRDAVQTDLDYGAALDAVDRQNRLARAALTPQPDVPAQKNADTGAASTPTGMPSGWAHGVVRFASDHRGVHDLAVSDVHSALERLVERGEVSEDVAEAAKQGNRIGRDTQERITAEALAGYGLDPDRPYAHRGGGGSAPGPNGGTSPVRNLAQYQSAASGYQAAAARAAQRAHADGDFELMALVESMAAAAETDFPPAARLREAAELVNEAADETQRRKRQAALAPLLRRYQISN